MSGVLNKLKEAVSGGNHQGDNTTHGNTTTPGYSGSGTAPNTEGPHNTDAANRADPRVDADGDGRAGYEVGENFHGTTGSTTGSSMGAGVGHPDSGIGKNTTSTPLFGSKDNHLGHSEQQDLQNYESRHGHTSGLSAVEGAAEREATHHNTTGSSRDTTSSGVGYGQNISGSGLSSRDNTTGYGSSGNTTGEYGTTGNTSSGYGSSTTTSGPHSSSIANKLDPRVDSDRDGSRGLGSTGSTTGNQYSTGSGEAGYPHHHTGLHAAEVISELKPGTNVDSDVHHRHNLYMSDKIEDYEAGSGVHTRGDPNYGLSSLTGNRSAEYDSSRTGTTGGIGSTTGGIGSTTGGNTTASGPHNSNLLNKADPRVDSDRDGSTLH